jgi:DNA polymerase III sliding clamp (beta) subunit (PCNA family)
MKIDRNYQLDKATSKDELRVSLQHILLEKEYAVATDGRILAKVPIENHELRGLLNSKAISTARKMQKTADLDIRLINNTASIIKMDKNGAHDASETVELKRYRADEDGTEPMYPNWKSVVPKHERPHRFGFEVQYLIDLAQAIGADKVVFEVDVANNTRAIIVKPWDVSNKARGLIMPLRIDQHIERQSPEPVQKPLEVNREIVEVGS